MRTRVVVAGLALLAALAGCTAAEPTADGGPTASPSASPTATAASPTRSAAARLDCDALLPVERASSALGLPARELEGSRDEAVRTSAEVIRRSAEKNGGALTCSWFGTTGTASIAATAVEDAADAFATAARPGPRLATDVEAYGECSADSCRVDVLAGTTWVTLALSGAPADADLATLASETAADASGALDEPITATAPVCAELLSPEELTTTGGLAQAVPGAGTEGVAAATASAAAAARAGFVSCTWTDPTSSAYSGISVDGLPHGEEGWRDLSLTSGLAVVLTPLDGLGDKALSGCGGGSCEVDVLDNDVWWRVLATGDEARAQAVARAVIARAS